MWGTFVCALSIDPLPARGFLWTVPAAPNYWMTLILLRTPDLVVSNMASYRGARQGDSLSVVELEPVSVRPSIRCSVGIALHGTTVYSYLDPAARLYLFYGYSHRDHFPGSLVKAGLAYTPLSPSLLPDRV